MTKLSVVIPESPDLASDPAPYVATPGDLLQELGAHLRMLRQQRSLSIEDISALTQIQPKLIQAIEMGQIEILPEAIYVKGMVKRYGDSLGFDGDGLAQYVPTWQTEVIAAQQASHPQTPFTAVRIAPIYIYALYTLVIIASGAGISHLINETVKPTTVIERGIIKH